MIFKKIIRNLWIIRSFHYSIFFNFHYLPLSQAIHLPILLYRPKIINCKGSITIVGKVKSGMIKLGKPTVSLYPNSGIIYNNEGGNIIFKGSAVIGNCSSVAIGNGAIIEFGDYFRASASFKVASMSKIKIGASVLFGWDCLLSDSDFHQLKNVKGEKLVAYSPIIVGDNCWFALKCVILKGTVIPSECVIAANSLLNKVYTVTPNTLLAGIPAKALRTGVFWNPYDDIVEYGKN